MNNPFLAAVLTDPAFDQWEGAPCRQTDPEIFFPEQGVDSYKAKAICWSCDLRQKCLDVALADPSLHGIWGGKTGKQRKAIRAQERVA